MWKSVFKNATQNLNVNVIQFKKQFVSMGYMQNS